MEIELNNADVILHNLEYDGFSTINKLIPYSIYNEVKITDDNIKNNSNFIVDLWDYNSN